MMTVLGFPLRVSPWLPVVLFALGQGSGPVEALVAFVVGGVVAILVHELGHAVAARAAGASDVQIELVPLGGLTTYAPVPPSRLRRIGIAVAGPLTGVAIGVPLLLWRFAVPGWTTTAAVLDALVWVTLGWAVLNLLPVRPFDGGAVLESILPGTPATRTRVAALISVAVAGALVAWAWSRGSTWTAAVFLVVAAMNLVPLLARERTEDRQSPEQRSYAVLSAVLRGDLGDARGQAAGGRVDPAVIALLDALEGRGDGSRVRALAEDRPDPLRRSCRLALEVSCRNWPGVAAVAASGPLPPGVIPWAMGAARSAGLSGAAAQVGQAALSSGADATTAYLTARCWGAAGENERAYEALVYARALGFTDLAAAAAEPDLAGVRTLPAWHALLSS